MWPRGLLPIARALYTLFLLTARARSNIILCGRAAEQHLARLQRTSSSYKEVRSGDLGVKRACCCDDCDDDEE